MKKILMALTALLVVLNWGCTKQDDIVFEHEKPMFEIKSDAILIEVIVPYGTSADGDAIYMAGPVTGEDAESVIGNETWKLIPSGNSHKWGIYVKPSDFASGKTLADGYLFVSALEGEERDLADGDILHTETANVGERINNVRVVRWKSYFLPPPEIQWPAVPDGEIQLRFTVPDGTPDGYNLGLVGEFNGWDGAKKDWLLTQLSSKYYYINLDPALFADGKSLADKFFANLFTGDRDWWYHQNNDDGSGEEGPGFTVADAKAGKSYNLTVANWRNSADLPAGIPAPASGEFLLKITVPDYTPANSLIGLFGGWNGWGAMLEDKDKWTATYYPSGVYALLVKESNIAEGTTLADMFHITLYYPESTDGNWWKHQMNLDGSEDEGPGINNAGNDASPKYTFASKGTYTIAVPEWRNSEDIQTPAETGEERNVLVAVPDDWDACSLHYWGGAPGTEWPGLTGSPVTVGGEKYYHFVLPREADGKTISMIANNGNNGKQSKNMTDVTIDQDHYFEVVDTETAPAEVTDISVRIYVDMSATDWTALALYTWGGYEAGEWPGIVYAAADPKTETIDAVEYKYLELPAAATGSKKVCPIFNNNNDGKQTSNGELIDLAYDHYYQIKPDDSVEAGFSSTEIDRFPAP